MNKIYGSRSGIHLMPNWEDCVLSIDTTIREAIHNLDRVGVQIALVCDQSMKLQGTISDGDIRRALLNGFTLENSIAPIIHSNPLVVPATFTEESVLQLMAANQLRQMPVVDEANRVLGLHLWCLLAAKSERANVLVIMAGGKGVRLRPHTETCPKPMLEIGGRPMLEHIILRAKSEGFEKFIISINYLGHVIENYFGCGDKFDVQIEYLREDTPLGTAGSLSFLEVNPLLPFVVTNGDVITDVRYGELLDFHTLHSADATMAVRLHEWQHPFGVVQMRGIQIVGFEEKPISRSHINAGVYVLSPSALMHLSRGKPCDMPTLFERLQTNGLKTIAYPMHEPWLDVGRPADLQKAEIKVGNRTAEPKND